MGMGFNMDWFIFICIDILTVISNLKAIISLFFCFIVYLQNTLRAHNIPRTHIARNSSLTRIANRNRKSLERTLRSVVVIVAISAANVQGHPGRLRKALQSMRDHLRAQVADLLALEAQIDHRPRPTREVDHRPRERLVERGVAASEPLQRLPGAQCGGEGFAQR